MQITRTTNKISKFESINYINTNAFMKNMEANEFQNTLAFGTYNSEDCELSIFFFEVDSNSNSKNGNIKAYVKKDSVLYRCLIKHFNSSFDEVKIDGEEYIEGVNLVGATSKSFKAEKSNILYGDTAEEFYDIECEIINNEKIKFENGYTIYFPNSSEGIKEALFENNIKLSKSEKHINVFSNKNRKLSYHEWWNAFVDSANKVIK